MREVNKSIRTEATGKTTRRRYSCWILPSEYISEKKDALSWDSARKNELTE